MQNLPPEALRQLFEQPNTPVPRVVSEEFLQRRARGETDFRGIRLVRADLRGIDLAGCALANADLSGADLREANLRDTDLRGARLATGTYDGMYRGSRWHTEDRTDLRRACLAGARLENAVVFADLLAADLSGAILDGASLSSSMLLWANLEDASLRNADLSHCTLSETRGRGADLRGALLRRTDLQSADFSAANFEGATLIDTNIHSCQLTGANLRGAICVHVDFTDAADLSGAILTGIITQDIRLQPILQRMQGLARSTWKPITQAETGELCASKYGGRFWLAAGEPWPQCGVCRRSMTPVLQLDLQDLPPELPDAVGSGILQIFCCSAVLKNSYDEGEQYFNTHGYYVVPFSPDKLVRIVHPDGETGVVDPAIEADFPTRRIVGWEPLPLDYPSDRELPGLGIEIGEEGIPILYENEIPRYQDKLAGWPRWIQDVEYPSCRKCSKPMDRLLYQFEREALDGCDGLVYVFQCRTHVDMVTFVTQ